MVNEEGRCHSSRCGSNTQRYRCITLLFKFHVLAHVLNRLYFFLNEPNDHCLQEYVIFSTTKSCKSSTLAS